MSKDNANFNVMKIRGFTLFLSFLFTPAFVYGVASVWAVVFLFVFVHVVRALCQSSLRRYKEMLSYTNEPPKIKGIVIELCAYLSLPFLVYIFIIGDLNAAVSSGLDRALILSLPLEAIKLPIDGDFKVLQMLLFLQFLLLIFGWGGGMLYARKEIAAMTIYDLPKNTSWNNDATDEEKIRHNDLWLKYYYGVKLVYFPFLFAFIFAQLFLKLSWTIALSPFPIGHFYNSEYILILPIFLFMPHVMFLLFFAIAFNCITWGRSR